MVISPKTVVVLGAPLVAAVVALVHPPGVDLASVVAADVNRWLLVHLVQLPVFALLASSVYLLIEGLRGPAATTSRVGLAFFVVFYIALDAIAGISSGVIVHRAQQLSGSEQESALWLVDGLSADFSAPLADGGAVFAITVLGGLGWAVAVTAAAVAVRRAGAPLGAAVLIALSLIFVAHDAPTAPLAMVCMFAGIAWSNRLTRYRDQRV